MTQRVAPRYSVPISFLYICFPVMYLNCHSYYSYRYGTLSEEELLKQASEAGIGVLALTDINSTSASLSFVRLSAKYGVRPVLGIDFRNDATCMFIGLARNNEGFRELNEFLSFHRHQHIEIPSEAPEFQHCFVIYPFQQVLKMDKHEFRPNEWIGIAPQDLVRLRFSTWTTHMHRCVALLTWSFGSKIHFNLHRLLRSIDANTLLSKLSSENQGREDEKLYIPVELNTIYQEAPELLQRSQELLEQCSIFFDFSEGRPSLNLKTYCGDTATDRELLHRLCKEGLSYRYQETNPIILQRLEKELSLIEQMNFISFFLINWDIVTYAQHKGYYHVGRGSGANSIVAYLLGITDVDPIELDLYFERFMNLYRVNPPDFDIDFSTWDRPDMTRYIFERFGKNGQASLLGAYSTFQYSASVRELGKVFGLPKSEVDLLSDGKFDPKSLDQIAQLILRYAKRMTDMPNYLTVHAAGILISEKPIHSYSATDLPPKGFPTVHFDMHVAEDVGLHKFDILGQRGLGKIKDSLSIIKENQPEVKLPDIHDVKPILEDPKVNAMIKQAQCIGCFYVESPAMRTLIKKLEVDHYLALVAASSIIRPGVAQSGMMREYILRHKDPERRRMAHPVMWDLMPETYGVMVYQEDVIKVAHHFAGLSLGEADVLRRGMSGKYRSREEFQQVHDQFISNCRAKGYPDQLIQEVWHQIESFAGYAFAKGHSASYAVESYQSLYLKTYYPLEFMVAVLNNGGGYYSPELYVHEARIGGATVVSPCINHSGWHTTIQGKTIYLGFSFIQSIEKEGILRLIQDREDRGLFSSFDQFLDRVYFTKEQLQILIRVGAFQSLGIEKRKLLWQALFNHQHEKLLPNQYRLFQEKRHQFSLPDLPATEIEDAFDQLDLLGFMLIDPFRLGKNMDQYAGSVAAEMPGFINKYWQTVGYLIAIKNTRTQKGEAMQFGTFIDRQGQWLDTVHFPPSARRYRFKGRGLYSLKGIVRDDFGALTLEVESMYKIPFLDDPRYTD